MRSRRGTRRCSDIEHTEKGLESRATLFMWWCWLCHPSPPSKRQSDTASLFERAKPPEIPSAQKFSWLCSDAGPLRFWKHVTATKGWMMTKYFFQFHIAWEGNYLSFGKQLLLHLLLLFKQVWWIRWIPSGLSTVDLTFLRHCWQWPTLFWLPCCPYWVDNLNLFWSSRFLSLGSHGCPVSGCKVVVKEELWQFPCCGLDLYCELDPFLQSNFGKS